MFRISARTVLELGSELISTDIIAFYELIKNCFDARSATGVDIRFTVALRRNSYLQLRSQAVAALATSTTAALPSALALLKDSLQSSLDPSAGTVAYSAFGAILNAADLAEFVAALDTAYRCANTIEVADTGSGMSLQELSENYLVIGTSSRKREIERSIREGGSHTPYLGEKGIGRLSAMRLGERLLVETARVDDVCLNVLDIDWRRFDDLEAMVEDVPIEPVMGDPKPQPEWSGTRLFIGNLSRDWTEERVRHMAEYDFARLTDPFADAKARPRVALFWNGLRVAIPWMDRALLNHAHATVKGSYSLPPDGNAVLRCTLDAIDLGFNHPRESDSVTLALPDIDGIVVGTSGAIPPTALVSVGPFEFEVYWYNRRRLARIESIGDQREVRDLQKKWSGILLFRDGFRVFPYGEDEDDWLALDRKALSRPGYTLNKTQFVGRVSITRTGNPELIDQTNREGLRATPEQETFVTILQYVIQSLLWDFLRQVEKRYKQQQPVELGDVTAQVAALEVRANTALRRIRRAVPSQEASIIEDLEQALLEFKDLADRAQKRIAEVEADSRQMIQMAGVGLLVEVVAHELARASENALQALEGLRGKPLPSDVQAKLDTLRSEMKSVNKRLRVLDPLSVSGRQRAEVFDIGALVDDLRGGHAAQFARHNIAFNATTPNKPVRVRAVKGMVVQILENLIANSVYWLQLRAARSGQHVPSISIRLEGSPVTVYFSDNGPGIAAEHSEKVFRPFWSLKEKAKRRGLGLFIARECATYLGGRLFLSDRTDPQTQRLHEFILEFPEAASVP